LYKCGRRDWHLENVINKAVIFFSGHTPAATAKRQRFADSGPFEGFSTFIAVSVTP
jgi:hypothetical protein